MKKIISLILATTMILSTLSGCAMGIGDNPMPTRPAIEEPSKESQPEETMPNPDAIYILGMFYRTTSGGAVLLSKDIGPLVLHNDINEFQDIMDFAIIKAETETIMESYPAQTTIKNWGVTNTATVISDYKSMVDEMIEMGYTPVESFCEEEAPSAIQLSTSPYDRYAKIMDNSSKDNVLFSPLSLNFALGMLSNSADDNALPMFEEYFGMSVTEYNDCVQTYMDNADPERGNTVVEIANGIWVRDDYTLMEKFQQNLENKYYAAIASRAFGPELVQEINDWCAKKTHDMIPFILDTLPNDSASVLVNALYFNAEWMNPYEEYQIRDEDFTAANGTVVTIDGLHETNKMPYYENDCAVAFSKLYKDGRYSFVGILPKNEGDFTIESLDLESLMESQSEKDYEVVSMIPKFKFDNTHEMLPLLHMADLPVDKYLYPNMVNENPLGVSKVIQKTAINLTESGTTAAAVTAIVMKDYAISVQPEEVERREVILNRPFAFMIYDNELQIPLFIGKITTL